MSTSDVQRIQVFESAQSYFTLPFQTIEETDELDAKISDVDIRRKLVNNSIIYIQFHIFFRCVTRFCYWYPKAAMK